LLIAFKNRPERESLLIIFDGKEREILKAAFDLGTVQAEAT
jgi:hypothetical protein